MAGYGTDDGFTTWLSANGYTLPDGAPTAAVLCERGSAYIDASYGSRFVRTPTDPAQEREWPRKDATIFGAAIASTDTPQRIIQASYQAAWIEASSPGTLSVVVDPAKRVKRQKVDVIEREFFEPGEGAGGVSSAPVSSAIEGLLAPLLLHVGGIPAILVV